MKTSSKILIVIVVVLSFFVGLLIGITVDFPKTEKEELTGTIGKVSNYRNVKVSENDVKLRSELMSNATLLKSYQQYMLFHYTSCVKLCEDIDFAVQAAENVSLFREDNSMEIENLKQYRQTLEQIRKDLLLAVTALQNLSTGNDNDIMMLVNNANVSIAQVKYKQNELLAFVDALEKFLLSNNPHLYSDLIKAHDRLSVNQLILAAATNDKPVMKYFDKKQLFTANENLQVIEIASAYNLKLAINSDFKQLESFLLNNENLKAGYTSNELISNIEGQLGVIVLSFEKLGGLVIFSNEKVGAVYNKENLGMVLNTEKLGAILNSEKLGLFGSEKLGFLNFEKLGAANVENLNIE